MKCESKRSRTSVARWVIQFCTMGTGIHRVVASTRCFSSMPFFSCWSLERPLQSANPFCKSFRLEIIESFTPMLASTKSSCALLAQEYRLPAVEDITSLCDPNQRAAA